MYNKLYTYLTENNILFNLQFGFRCQHSTEHAIVELVDKILNGFSEEKYIPGFLLTFLKHLILLTIKFFLKNLVYTVLKVKVLSGLRATFQRENNI